MVTNKKEKEIVNIQYPCYICANEYSGARQVISHVENMHGYILNPRQIGHHRPPSNKYSYENDIKKKWDVQHFGCPSCWFHCPQNFETLMQHIMIEHEPAKVDGFVQKVPDDEIEEYETDEEEKDELQESDEEEESQKGSEATDRRCRSTSVSPAAKKEGDQKEEAPSTGKETQERDIKEDPVAASATSMIKDVGRQASSSSKDVEATGGEQGGDDQDADVTHEIMQKLNDLSTMFKQLFKS